ncbi:AcrR family transcriptional regulator [Cytobacillus horneckiae]|uniref:TetR/AcrR family transcriptional regulator n=1 Tax=Cytobacillus horneckiae TaxID=549687 RepID=A0A2N0ZAI1_9BACI|nr:forespore capture DNA-binding protein RefZ [Cytobacillus horneckiae]NRG44741.1 forespore capture DNA-binding protein RefZ [Bacillus sp. CRN 9]MBN6888016.1 forespore capture DNA-binding protein RefZ [Cytobacillus horneckiae]MCM3179573.1 forespore capture DNA-binding protein RefZ [Cytobacillus horneckiae]MEC1154997.1 forespore capture DNA-binding protein RefZ [Cytobacillus horneckiae]MED2936097.1 forespore capture DNA-binding protein RefZ [Cytobacillus horneckiae]
MKENSKAAIIEAAVFLFNHNGFNGTSIRDIAKKARTNVANISYYFGNKNGLLEHCLTEYYEAYLLEIEKGYSILENGATESLKAIVENIIYFQYENIQLTRLIVREMSIDSQIVREIMSTYLTKERFYFSKVFEKGFKNKEFRINTANYLILQLKSLLTMPFLNSQYVAEVLHLLPHEKYFADKYIRETYTWIDRVVCSSNQTRKLKANLLRIL